MQEGYKKLSLWTEAYLLDQSTLWYVFTDVPILIKYDIRRHLEEITEIPLDCIGRVYGFGGIIKAGQKLYLMPRDAKRILVYDVLKKNFDHVDIPREYCEGKLNFRTAILVGNCIYMRSFKTKGFIIYNIESREFTSDKSSYNEMLKVSGEKISLKTNEDKCRDGFLFTGSDERRAFRFNTRLHLTNIYEIGKEDEKLRSAIKVGQCIYMIQYSVRKGIIEYNVTNGRVHYYYPEFSFDQQLFIGRKWVVEHNSRLWYLPQEYEENIFTFDLNTHEFKLEILNSEEEKYLFTKPKTDEDDNVYFYESRTCSLFMFYKERLKVVPLFISNVYKKEGSLYKLRRNSVNVENQWQTLSDLVLYVKHSKGHNINGQEENGIGRYIYEALRQG